MRIKILGIALVILTLVSGIHVFQNVTGHSATADGMLNVEYFVPDVKSEGNERLVSARQIRNAVRGEKIAEVVIEKSFKVRSGQNLHVDIAHSDVEITTGSTTEATVTVSINSRNMERARERFEKMKWEVFQDGDAVVVRAESPKGNWNVNMDINVLISLPSTFNLDLKTSHGDVNLDALNGEVNLQTSHGDVKFAALAGEGVWIKSSHGDISGGSVTSNMVQVQTSHADIRIDKIDSGSFVATTSHADIEIGYLKGDSELSTSHGDIQTYLAGSGSASFETQHGDIEVMLDSAPGVDLDLRAPRIDLDRSMRVDGNKRKDRVLGSVNGGGNLVRARTTHGAIALSDR